MPFFNFIYKLVTVILLGVAAFILCVPIITAGPPVTALYYTIVKTVRHERGYFWKTFFEAFRMNLKKGMILSIILGIYLAATGYAVYLPQAAARASESNSILPYTIGALFITGLMVLVYIFPVLSRFEHTIKNYFLFSFYLSLRYLAQTILFFVLVYGSAALLLFVPETRLIAFALPGCICYLVSIPMEKIFRKHMPPAPENKEDIPWYWE